MLDNNTKKLINEFHKIARKRWIKSVSKSFGAIGLTFERELNKAPDSTFLPDYYGTEIKSTSRYSRYPIFLFTVAFDDPTFPEINRIVEKYGYYDKDYKDKKVLFEKLNCQMKCTVNNKYKFKLEVDQEAEKMFLCVYDLKNKLIERKSYIYLETIKKHLTVKLNRLAIVHASTKTIEEEKQFRYYKLEIYNLISYENFIDMLNKGFIDVSLIARISKSGIDTGRYRNKNLVFQIKKDRINKLFEKNIFIWLW